MSVRVNISIPDELNERVKKVKKEINISKVCTLAIEQAVKIEEIKLSDMPDFEKLALRVKEEMIQDQAKDEERGFVDGQIDAKNFTYEKFKKFIPEYYMSQDYQRQGEETDEIDENLFYEFSPIEREKQRESEPQSVLSSVYEKGWVKGVGDIYSKIQQYIFEDKEKDKNEK